MPANFKTNTIHGFMRGVLVAGLSTSGVVFAIEDAGAEAIDRDALEGILGEPITLSATGAPLRATDAPVNMTIITQEQIQRSGAIDIPGVLERFAQVDVDTYTSGDTEVSIRGYNQPFSPRLLVLVNGRQVYLDVYAQTVWSLIPVQLSEIRQIEIVTGPNTALFGFNAVAGVVNIITYDPLSDDIDAFEVTVGSDAYRAGNFALTGRLSDNLAGRFSARIAEGDGWESEEAPAASYLNTPRGINNYTLNGQISAQLTPQVRASLELSNARDRRLDVSPEKSITDTHYESTGLVASLSADSHLGLLEGQTYYNTLDMTVSLFGVQTSVQNHVLVSSAAWANKVAPAHTLRLAGEYRRNWMSLDGGFFGVANADLNYDVYAFSAMWNWALTENLTSTIAVRNDMLRLKRSGPATSPNIPADNSTRELTEPSYNAGLVWRPSPLDTFRATAARGVQSPSLVEFGIEQDTPFLQVLGDHHLNPTIVENFELAWDRTIEAIGGRLRTSIYWQTNEDLKYLLGETDPGPPIVITSANIGSSDLVGADVSLQGLHGNLDWRLEYSHREVDDSLTTAPGSIPLNYEATTPSDIATAAMGWTFGPWRLDALVRHVSDTTRFSGSSVFGYMPATIDAYTTFNANIAWRAAEHVTLALSGRNLFDDETQTTDYAAIPRSVYFSLRSSF